MVVPSRLSAILTYLSTVDPTRLLFGVRLARLVSAIDSSRHVSNFDPPQSPTTCPSRSCGWAGTIGLSAQYSCVDRRPNPFWLLAMPSPSRPSAWPDLCRPLAWPSLSWPLTMPDLYWSSDWLDLSRLSALADSSRLSARAGLCLSST